MLELFGLEPYIGALIIAVLGIGAATVFGWLAATGKYDPRKAATSVLIGFPAAIIVRAAAKPAEPAPIITTSGLAGMFCAHTGIVALASKPETKDLRVKSLGLFIIVLPTSCPFPVLLIQNRAMFL